MKWGYIFAVFFVFALAPPAFAQSANGEVVSEPICFTLINTTDHGMNGSIRTQLYTREDGTQARHTSNYRLQAKGSVDHEGYPADRVDFCSYGPFYEGRKLELVIRTLWPVFSCITNIESGPIMLGSTPIESGYRYWAECFE